MKITVLQGSPHKNGSSNFLAEQFIKGAEENGHRVTVLDAAHMDLHPCIGCGKCGMNGICVHKDDNSKIAFNNGYGRFRHTDLLLWNVRTVKNRHRPFLQLYYAALG